MTGPLWRNSKKSLCKDAQLLEMKFKSMSKIKKGTKKLPNSPRENNILATSSASTGKNNSHLQCPCREHQANRTKSRRKELLLTLMLKNSSLQICLAASTNPKKKERSVKSPHPDSPRNKRSKPKMGHVKTKLILLKIKLNNLKCWEALCKNSKKMEN